MIEDIIFESKSNGSCEIRLQHSTGETTVLGFSDSMPMQMQDTYIKAITVLQKKNPDIAPSDNLFGLFTYWFAKCGLNMPMSVGTFSNNDRQRIGKRIKELREEQHMDAKHLSLITGIDASNISRIEQGKYSVGLDVLTKIANALGCKVDLVKL
jgi:DNA-binding Xre family transcriptional regulator